MRHSRWPAPSTRAWSPTTSRRALRAALDDPAPDYAERALAAIAPYRRAAVDAVVRDELLPRLLTAAGA